MQVIADRKGNLTKVNSTQDKILKKLYTHWIGRILLKPLVSPAVSVKMSRKNTVHTMIFLQENFCLTGGK